MVLILEDNFEEVTAIHTVEVEVVALNRPNQRSEENVKLEEAINIQSEMHNNQTSAPKQQNLY